MVLPPVDKRDVFLLPSKEETGNPRTHLVRLARLVQSLRDGYHRLLGRIVMEVHVVQQPSRFGEELRRRRLAAGLTLTCLAQRIHYSKGQLSKVERGIKSPSRELVHLCDAALDAGGALTSLVRDKPHGPGVTVTTGHDRGEVWLMQLCDRDRVGFSP